MTDVMMARDELVTAVLRYVAAERALQGPTPHASASDELEYAEEMVDQAALDLVEANDRLCDARQDHLMKAVGGPRCGFG